MWCSEMGLGIARCVAQAQLFFGALAVGWFVGDVGRFVIRRNRTEL